MFKVNLICQYFKVDDTARQTEIDVCLAHNLNNEYIDKIHLLTEKDFIYSNFPKPGKIISKCINCRLTYKQAFSYAATFPKNEIWILANADIYFDNSLQYLEELEFGQHVYALSRHDVLEDGSKFFCPDIYAHGSQDAWIFKGSLDLQEISSSFCLGIPSCDQKIAYELVNAGYIVLNPSLKIIVNHLDVARQLDVHARTQQYVAITNEEGFKAGIAAPPPYQVFLYPTEKLKISKYEIFKDNLRLNGLVYAADVKVNELKNQICHLESIVRGQHQELVDCNALVSEKEARIAKIYQSMSWRVTKPLRGCLDFLRGLHFSFSRFLKGF